MLRHFSFGTGRRSWTAGVRAALAIPAIALVALDVSSLSLSTTDVAAGGSVTGTVTVTGAGRGLTRVALESSNTSVATVPAAVSVGRAGTFTARAVSGAAGCAVISARVGTTPPKSQTLFVQAPSTSGMGLGSNPSSIVGGASATGRVVVINPGSNTTVQLSSSNPVVTVPASVQVQPEEGGAHAASFTINSSVVAPTTCTVITATHGASRARKMLKVVTISG